MSQPVQTQTDSATAAPVVPLQITEIEPVRFERRGDIYFADFGQDVYGNLQITLAETVPAATLIIRLGEKLNADDTVDRKPGGNVRFLEIPLAIRPGQRTYRLDIPSRRRDRRLVVMPPEIGEVWPFRYAEIEGAPIGLDPSAVRQLFVHAPFEDNASSFESSDATLNAVWQLCKHTMKATTAFGIYIDGERERRPYDADAYINMLSHYACDLDPRVAHVTIKNLANLMDPTWPVDWTLHLSMLVAEDYLATGDSQLAASLYDGIKQKKLLLDQAREDGLLRGWPLVDWPAVERDGYSDGLLSPHNSMQVGPDINTVANAFYYHALRQMAMLATALNRDDEARDLEVRAARVYESFNRVFFDPACGIYIDGEGHSHASLHANMFALTFGLTPAEREAKVADFVQSRGMACSVYAAQYLLEALFKAGRDAHAVGLMAARTKRSWWNMIQLGSTMTLEAWDPEFKPNLDWNHAWARPRPTSLHVSCSGCAQFSPDTPKC